VFAVMAAEGKSVGAVVAERGLASISDRGQVAAAVAQVIRDHPGPVAQYRGGKTATFGFLVGQVMKATRGQADPQMVREALQDALASAPEG
jgi:aspartyl-tRNA(Asn)/glutamyl-tRNA(Gln) amidotransferase subunit B